MDLPVLASTKKSESRFRRKHFQSVKFFPFRKNELFDYTFQYLNIYLTRFDTLNYFFYKFYEIRYFAFSMTFSNYRKYGKEHV